MPRQPDDLRAGDRDAEVQPGRVQGQGHQDVLHDGKFGVGLNMSDLDLYLSIHYGCNFIVSE